MSRVWLLALIWVGCSAENQFESNFPRKYCSFYATCNGDAFEALFGDTQTCQSEQERWLVDYKLCTYDEAAGSACLDALTSLECGEFANSVLSLCSDVIYDCS